MRRGSTSQPDVTWAAVSGAVMSKVSNGCRSDNTSRKEQVVTSLCRQKDGAVGVVDRWRVYDTTLQG